MPRPTTLTRHVATIVATTALVVSGLVAGVGTAGAIGSSDFGIGLPNHPELIPTATRTAENVSVTREVIGPNAGYAGDKITFKTTISAAAGPARQVTRIVDRAQLMSYVPNTAKLTYTSADGTRTTEAVTPTYVKATYDGLNLTDQGGMEVSSAGWPISVDSGATVVFEITYQWIDFRGRPSMEDGVAYTGVGIDVTGLDTMDWPKMTTSFGSLNEGGPFGS
ncbi:hypothetical protein FCG67_02215 [Rhodococcus oryzae]|uniref:DUF4352 domain-containing protein n=1 Tax=Rhodococcus oryzae TaxID=2571143 RepID=A0ABY2RQY0_9NOCA|nr:hypothetical protein [Rhodococcus oryzae]TJZ81460.1 hypothetical protein FCG67_02215 [Rhodococcus oryzae]